jgi:hypothetical protein
LALTGESLPVDKKAGDDTYSGSIAKQGEMDGVVTATGMNTYFGKRTSRLTGRCCAILDRNHSQCLPHRTRWREHAQTPHARLYGSTV